MKPKKDPHRLAKIERAIEQKYGKEAVEDIRKSWTPEKEEEYLEQLKQLIAKEDKFKTQTEKVEMNGFLVAKALINKVSNRACPVCKKYSFKSQDDVYMTKFDCCYKCYIQWVEGREGRWKTGWRPNSED